MPKAFEPLFTTGYNDAAEKFGFGRLPVNMVIDIIDGYKKAALANETAYYLGIVYRMEEELGARDVLEGMCAA